MRALAPPLPDAGAHSRWLIRVQKNAARIQKRRARHPQARRRYQLEELRTDCLSYKRPPLVQGRAQKDYSVSQGTRGTGAAGAVRTRDVA